jgi:hypothetical protein
MRSLFIRGHLEDPNIVLGGDVVADVRLSRRTHASIRRFRS